MADKRYHVTTQFFPTTRDMSTSNVRISIVGPNNQEYTWVMLKTEDADAFAFSILNRKNVSPYIVGFQGTTGGGTQETPMPMMTPNERNLLIAMGESMRAMMNMNHQTIFRVRQTTKVDPSYPHLVEVRLESGHALAAELEELVNHVKAEGG